MRRLARALVIIVALLAVTAGVEQWLEAREARAVTADDTFAQLGPVRVRYKLRGNGPSVVFLTGMAATLEQFDRAQTAIAPFATSLTYDRGGSGFSSGSRAFDGEQQSDELAMLLHTLGVPQPVVLVAFSSSAAFARVYTGRYRYGVSAMVLLDPYFAELEDRLVSPFRASSYTSWLVPETARALFGVRRAFPWENSQDLSAAHQKAVAAQRRFWHWLAVDREWIATARTNRQASAADHALTDLPLIVLVGDTSELGEVGPVHNEVVREFVARSRQGSIRRLAAGDHGDMSWRGPNYEDFLAAIRDAVAMGTGGAPMPPPARAIPPAPR